MKKISLSLICAGLVTFASADFLSLSAGAGYEEQQIGGYVKNGDTINYFSNSAAETDGNPKTGNLGLDDKANPYLWVKLIHPIPIIPNIKLQYTHYHSTGHSKWVSGNVEIFGDVSIPYGLTNVDTKMDINSYDLTLFYEIKPIFADIEAGFGVDLWKGNTRIEGDDATNGTAIPGGKHRIIDEDWFVALPYLYGNVETMQIFGFSALGYFKWAKAGDNHHYEYLGALKYTFDIIGPVNPFIKVGYKYKEAYGVDGNNETKLKYEGVFAEIGAKF